MTITRKQITMLAIVTSLVAIGLTMVPLLARAALPYAPVVRIDLPIPEEEANGVADGWRLYCSDSGTSDPAQFPMVAEVLREAEGEPVPRRYEFAQGELSPGSWTCQASVINWDFTTVSLVAESARSNAVRFSVLDPVPTAPTIVVE